MPNPKLRYATTYSKKYFDLYDTALQINDGFDDSPAVMFAADKAFNELHNEVSAWTKYPNAKQSQTVPNHELLKEACVIFKEVFG